MKHINDNGMTVRELVNILLTYNPEGEVWLQSGSGLTTPLKVTCSLDTRMDSVCLWYDHG